MTAPRVHFETPQATLVHGDCLEALRDLPDASIDSVVTDPPYGLANTTPSLVMTAVTKWASGDRGFIPDGRGFNGQRWDAFVPPPAVWDECMRVLKPGGHLLAFAGARTFDLMTLSIRFAGFDIRDGIAWLYGSGFPKNHDVTESMAHFVEHGSTVVERVVDPDLYRVTTFLREARDAAGWTNRRIDEKFGTAGMAGHWTTSGVQPTCPSPRQWAELKDALGFDDSHDELAARLGSTERPEDWGQTEAPRFLSDLVENKPDEPKAPSGWGTALKPSFEPIVVARKAVGSTVAANVLEHGTGALNLGGTRTVVDGEARWPANVVLDQSQADRLEQTRFFYVSKAPASEKPEAEGTVHETVKPLDLMQRLVRLVTPKGGTVLEPFAGSGTTLEAAIREGFDVIGVEREARYLPLIMARLGKPHQQTLFGDL